MTCFESVTRYAVKWRCWTLGNPTIWSSTISNCPCTSSSSIGKEIYLCLLGLKQTIDTRLKSLKFVKPGLVIYLIYPCLFNWCSSRCRNCKINPITSFQTTHHPTCILLSWCIHSNSSQLSGCQLSYYVTYFIHHIDLFLKVLGWRPYSWDIWHNNC